MVNDNESHQSPVITALQTENEQLKLVNAQLKAQVASLKHPQPANLVQINTLAKQNADNDALIIKLSSAQ